MAGNDRSGIGDLKLEDLPSSESTAFPEAMLEFQIHRHRTQSTPLLAHLSRVFYADKGNGKEGILSQRLLHLFCSWWNAYYGARLQQEMWNAAKAWPSYCHAYLKSRRREDAIGTQHNISCRLKRLGIESFGHFRDLTNAFLCTTTEVREETLLELVSPPTDNFMGCRSFFRQRLVNGAVLLPTSEGTDETVLPGCGNIDRW